MGALKRVGRWLSSDPTRLDAPALWALPPTDHDTASAPARKSRAQALKQSMSSTRTQQRASGELVGSLRRMARRRDNPEGGIASALATPKTLLNVAITPPRRQIGRQSGRERVYTYV